MESTTFQLMVEHGIHKHADSLTRNIIYIPQLKKSFIERTIQYIKERTECFDDYFPCTRINCQLEHLVNWLILFADMHNGEM
jgi:hypothetical protein